MKKIPIIILVHFFSIIVFGQTFNDAPGNETNGSVPQKWKILDGTSIIETFEGSKVIYLDNNSIITPDLNSEDYLTDSFSLEFDAYFNEVLKSMAYQVYEIRLWPGKEKVTIPSSSGNGYYAPIEIMRHEIRMDERQGDSNVIKHKSTESSLKNKVATWRSIRLEYNQGILKVFINNFELLKLAQFNYQPTMISIGTKNNEYGANFNRFIKNIAINGINSTNESSSEENEEVNTNDPIYGGYAYTFPKEDGLPNQILQTDGNGNVSWVDDNPDLSHNNDNGGDESTNNTGLEAIDEGNGMGWRLIGRNPDNTGNIGDNAIDLSYSNSQSSNRGATSSYAFSSGFNSSASNSSSTAMGHSTVASGVSATALGESSEAIGNISLAAGYANIASGNYSTALGYKSEAKGENSIAIGNNTMANGKNSSAFGFETKALEDYTTTFGYKTIASLNMSTAFGNETEASGFASTVFGEKSKASGGVAFAAGFESEAKGNYSTALGFKSRALNDFSTAIGNQNRASANSSSAFGTGTVANSESSFVVGTYNKDSFVSGLSDAELFVVGNGTSLTDRKDAFKIFKNGNANLSGTLSQSSDIRLKSNITPIKYGLEEIVQLKPVSYNWKSNSEISNKTQTFGLIAQEVKQIINELVTSDQSEDEMLSLSYIELIPVLIKAIQEQQAIIKSQTIKIDELSAHLSTNMDVVGQLKKRLDQIEKSLKTNQ